MKIAEWCPPLLEETHWKEGKGWNPKIMTLISCQSRWIQQSILRLGKTVLPIKVSINTVRSLPGARQIGWEIFQETCNNNESNVREKYLQIEQLCWQFHSDFFSRRGHCQLHIKEEEAGSENWAYSCLLCMMPLIDIQMNCPLRGKRQQWLCQNCLRERPWWHPGEGFSITI